MDMSHPALEHIADILERHSSLLDLLRETVHESVQGNDEAQSHRVREMFEAMLTGQHAMFDKLSEAAHGNDQVAETILSLHEAQQGFLKGTEEYNAQREEVEAIRAHVEATKADLSVERTEKDEFRRRLAQSESAKASVESRLAQKVHEMDMMETKDKTLQDEMVSVSAARLAAETERDALAKALREARDHMDSERAEVQAARQEVSAQGMTRVKLNAGLMVW